MNLVFSADNNSANVQGYFKAQNWRGKTEKSKSYQYLLIRIGKRLMPLQ
jgi:hypothetical protein